MNNIQNAKISGTMLGIEDHGIFTSFVYLETDGGGIGVGGYVLGGKSGIEYLKEILNVVGVEKWEDLKGKYCRVEFEDNRAKRIGNIIEDKWLDQKEFFKQYE